MKPQIVILDMSAAATRAGAHAGVAVDATALAFVTEDLATDGFGNSDFLLS